MSETFQDIYKRSVKELYKHLETAFNEDADHTIVVALARKGPRLLEFLDNEAAEKMHVVTEHALPFVFKNLASSPRIPYHFMIVDDAIYYGSTLEGIFKEIKSYQKMYGLKDVRITAFTAIQAKECKELDNDLEIVAEKDVPNGYGHYFVRQVMADIRTLHTSMEVEFPRISLKMNKSIDVDKLQSDLENVYPGRVYKVEHTENSSLNIILDAKQGVLFNKLRIFPHGDRLHIVGIAPRMIPNSIQFLEHIFDGAPETVSNFWNDVFKKYLDAIASYEDAEVRRSVMKSLVTLANFISSYDTISQEFKNYSTAISKQHGDIEHATFQTEDIQYLLGSGEAFQRMCKLFGEDELRAPKPKDYGVNLLTPTDVQVFESYEYPSKPERDELELHNLHMIRNCHNLQQALSAIFFNQNLLIERWSRQGTNRTSTRLRFGYTFAALKKLIENHRNGFNEAPDDLPKMHQWVDKRIDQGCIVPQYVCDATNNVWTRVFRPGENEDSQLSHLARWVLSVYQALDAVTGNNNVKADLLGGMLCVIAHRIGDQLVKELPFLMTIRKEGRSWRLLFKDEANEQMDLLRYMEKMYILSAKESSYSISQFLRDNDVRQYTTLSGEYMALQQGVVNDVKKVFEESGTDYIFNFLVYNYELRELFDRPSVQRIIHDVSESVGDLLYQLEAVINRDSNDFLSIEDSKALRASLMNLSGYAISSWLCNNRLKSGVGEDSYYLKAEKQIYQLNIVINILLVVYYLKDIERLSFMIRSREEFYRQMEAQQIYCIVNEMVEKSSLKQALTNRTLIFALRSLIVNQVLND